MRHRPETIFEHAIDMALKEFSYSSRGELEYGLTENLKQYAHSDNPEKYLTEDNIIYVYTCLWGLKWKPIQPVEHDNCDCGAKHTSFPGSHSAWCSVLNPNRIKEKQVVYDFWGREL